MTTTEITHAISIAFASLPPIGGAVEDGIFVGITTDKTGAHFAVVLLSITTDDKNWSDATAWAKEVGGQLPTRVVAALIYSNAKEYVGDDLWLWTCEEYSASYAWHCLFGHGLQYGSDKSYEGCARAVRLIPLVA